jgi:cell division GTPase FtsZ
MQINNSNIEFLNYKQILSKEGNIEGFILNKSKNEILEYINKNIKFFLENAQGVLVDFEISLDTSSFFINEIIAELNLLVNDNTELIFDTKINDALKKDKIKIILIITGL